MNRLKLVIFDLDDTLCDTSGQPGAAPQNIENIKLFPGTATLIEEIRSRGIYNAIVSTGDRLLQEKKVEILGLRKLVDSVFICDLPEDKLVLFKKCLHEFDAQPQETVVVGDRIDREILFGKSLHCVTIRLLQGRHNTMVPEGESQSADYTMQDIAALRRWFDFHANAR